MGKKVVDDDDGNYELIAGEKNRVPVTAINSNEMKYFSMKRRQNSESVK